MGETVALRWVPQGTFHHVGFVVSSIQDTVQGFAETLDTEWDGAVVFDPHQDARVTFLRSRSPADPLFELIEPASEHSPVLGFAKKGGGIHHICYVVDSLEQQLQQCRSQRSLVVRQAAPAAAFGGRRIAWVYTRNKLLIEYLER